MTLVRRRGAATALLLLAPLLTACGFNNQTDQVYQAATGTNERTIDGVDVLNALIVSAQDGQGTFAGSLSLPDEATKPVALTSITDGSLTAPVEVKPGEVVNLAQSGKVRLQGSDIVAGKFLPITFGFSDGKTVHMMVPVVANDGPSASVPVGSPSPTGRPVTGGKKASARTSASATATPSATETPVPSASPSAG
jgi:hypothetical protein